MTAWRLSGRHATAYRNLMCDAPANCAAVFEGTVRGEFVTDVRIRARQSGWQCKNPSWGLPGRDFCPEHGGYATPPGPSYEPGPDAGTLRVQIGEGWFATIDEADLPLIAPFSWRPWFNRSGSVYAYARSGVYMHRLIAGTSTGQETDHRNGDGLDNRRANLRTASPSQNRANSGKPRRPDGSAHTSQYKGVTWRKDSGKWSAKITALDPVLGRSRCRYLGMFTNEAVAARAYDAAALAQWGEFARLNFPPGEEVAG